MVFRAVRAALLLALAGCAGAPRHVSGSPETQSESERTGEETNGGSTPDGGAAATADTATADEGENDEGSFDDGAEGEEPTDRAVLPPHPFASLSDRELERRLVENPESLGSMSIGKPNAGMLFNATRMPEGEGWTLVDPSHEWGTDETVHYLSAAISAVDEQFPNSPKLAIGHISAKSGGYLRPHVSHQAGRDVDISYFYRGPTQWYLRATEENLDAERTWAFVRALVTLTDVDLLLIDHSIQKLLRDYAESAGENREWLDTLFHGRPGIPPIIRHAPGHGTHMHIRFYNPIAEETGRRCYAALVRRGLVHVGPSFSMHVAKKGETLAEIAKRYGTTVRAIRRANGLKSSVIQAKKAYRIPESGRAPPAVLSGPVAIPPRRLPPNPSLATDHARPPLG